MEQGCYLYNKYLPTILIYSFIQFSRSVHCRDFLRIDHLWPSKPIRWHFLDADKVWLARNSVLCWADCNISDLWSSASRFYVTKTEIKSMPNICLSWLELEPGIGREMNLKCFSTIYVPARSVRVIEISALSPHVTISHLLELCWSSAGALSNFIVLVAQVFDCEYFSPI